MTNMQPGARFEIQAWAEGHVTSTNGEPVPGDEQTSGEQPAPEVESNNEEQE